MKAPLTFEEIMARTVEQPNGCIEWQGATAVMGYGLINVSGKMIRLNRLLWELKYGSIPEGMFVCHHCDNPKCLNINHLFLGTRSDNMKDCYKKGRLKFNYCGLNKGETHCHAKLTSEQVLAIREDSRHKREIALDYGVTPDNISVIKRRINWKHI